MTILVGVLFPIGIWAIPTPESTMVLCKNKDVVRTIQIEEASGQCTTVYTKAGVDREVGNGRNRSSCERVLENIRGNLDKAGWRCREVSQVISSEKNP